MGISTVTGPTFEPVSLEEAKAQLRITASNDDGLIAGYIMAARSFVESSIHRVLAEQTFDFTIDFGWPFKNVSAYPYYEYPHYGYTYLENFARFRVELPLSPVTAAASVVSITYVDANGATQTLDPSQYVAIVDGPVPYIEPVFGVTWPIPRLQPACITIRFKAGYSTPGGTPEPVRMAILMLAGHFYNNREATSGDMIELPFGVEALISPFRQSRILS